MDADRRRSSHAIPVVVLAVAAATFTGIAFAPAANATVPFTYSVDAPLDAYATRGLALEAGTHLGYVTSGTTGSVINTVTKAVVGSPLDFPSETGAVAIDENTNTAYVLAIGDGLGAGSVSAVNMATNTLIGTPIPVGSLASAVAVDPGNHTLYVTGPGDGGDNPGTVSVINTSTFALITTDVLAAGSYLQGVAVDLSTHTAYVTDFAAGAVRVLDPVTHAVTSTAITVGVQPVGITVDQVAHRAYVANYGTNSTVADSSVSVINTSTNAVIATVAVSGGPWAVTVDHSTHTVYAAASSGGAVAAIDSGTFAITTVPVVTMPFLLAADPVTHIVYAGSGGLVDVIQQHSGTTTTTTALAGSPTPTAGEPVTFTATVAPSGAGGDVAFTDGTTVIDGCAHQLVTSGHASCTTTYGATGYRTVTAGYTGDATTYRGSTSAPLPFTVTRGASTTAPDAPSGAAAARGRGAATVSWTVPGDDGGSPITGYIATSTPGGATCASNAAPPTIAEENPVAPTTCVVSGLTSGTPYTFTVRATNAKDAGAPSAATNSVTPGDVHSFSYTDDGPIGAGRGGIAVDQALHRAVFVSATEPDANGRGSVALIDTTTDEFTGLPITVGATPAAIGIDQTHNTAFVVNQDGTGAQNYELGTVSVLNIATRQVVATLTVGWLPNHIAIDQTSHTAYVTNQSDADSTGNGTTVTVINTNTNTVTGTITGVGPGPTGIAVDETTHHAYVANTNSGNGIGPGSVSVIDTTTRLVTDTFFLGSGNPFAIAVDQGEHTAFVTSFGHCDSFCAMVSVIDTTTSQVVSESSIGTTPFGIAIDQGTHIAYTANSSDSTISVIDAVTNQVTDTLTSVNGPGDLAVDQSTHRIYVVGGLGVVSVLQQHTETRASSVAVTTSTNPTQHEPVILTATITPTTASGIVRFSQGGNPVTGCVSVAVQSGVASCTTSFGSTGSHTIAATYRGDALYVAATTSTAVSVAPGPPAVPDPPTGVTAVAANLAAHVSWTPPLDNGGSAITGYVITPYVGVAAQPATTVGNVTNATVTGLANGTTYTFTVHAVNAVSTSGGAESAPSVAVTPTKTPPGQPGGVTASAGNNQAFLSWAPPADDGGSVITGYQVTAHFANGGTYQPAPTGNVNTATVSGLNNGTAYTFTVHAINAFGSSPESSASAAVTPSEPAIVPGAPGRPSVAAGNGRVTLRWTAPVANGSGSITKYFITPYKGSTPLPLITVGHVLTATVSGLTNGAAYVFTVRARASNGLAGATSDASVAVTPRVPTTVVITSAPAVSTYGIPTRVVGRLSRADTGVPVGGQTVLLEARRHGTTSAYQVIRSGTSAAKTGLVRFSTFQPHYALDLRLVRAVVAGNPWGSSVSARRVMPCQLFLTAALDKTSTRTGVSVRLVAGALPSRPGKVVALQRLMSGTWTTVVSRTLGKYSLYGFTITPHARGTEKLRVMMKADATFTTSYSAIATLTVTA